MNCEYVRKYYGVPACIGRRVVCYGKPGIIAEDQGNYIGVTLDSDKPGTVNNYHPTDGIEYGEIGIIRKMSQSQARYQKYLSLADLFDDFADFLRSAGDQEFFELAEKFRALKLNCGALEEE